jgi:uncharacterized protein YrrD
MSDHDLLVRASELTTMPVVSLATGEDLAEVRDVVFEPDGHAIVGFTLNKRGWLAGRRKERLAATAVHAIGRDAIVVADDEALVERSDAPVDLAEPARHRDVLGDRVLTDDGTDLGSVVDVIVRVGRAAEVAFEVVGYEIGGEAVEHATGAQRAFVPVDAQQAVSGSDLVVPAAAREFIRQDLTGFGGAVDGYRERIGRTS